MLEGYLHERQLSPSSKGCCVSFYIGQRQNGEGGREGERDMERGNDNNNDNDNEREGES